jgi:peptidoglycan/xylan/chitin deacetylase (PgdA/CDA1 family)
MKLYWVKTAQCIKRFFSGFVWDMPHTGKTVYLTFDDGPNPEVTPWVLDLLKEHNIKATFFCIGDNIRKHPGFVYQIVTAGHVVGNHTYNHLNGWKTGETSYISNFLKCQAMIYRSTPHHMEPVKLFRPPYGKIKSAQAKAIRKLGYKIIMWDVLSADFDQAITPQKCLSNVVDNVRPGSIIIFHDSIKASVNLRYALPAAITRLKEEGYTFGILA